MSRSSVNYSTPPPQDKFRVAAKCRLIELGLTVTALSKDLRIQRSTVSHAINNPVFPSVRRRIAKKLGL